MNADPGDLSAIRVPDMERIRNARRKRQQQLKRWNQYDKSMEKDFQKKQKKGVSVLPNATRNPLMHGVQFSQNIILLEAAARDDLDEVRRLLGDGVCPNVTNTDGLTALHQCCIDDNQEMCRLLLRFGADVNARDTELWTPLHAAATCCHTDLCKLLIDNGADLMAVNADGNMPYDICEDDNTLDLIEGEMASRGVTQEDIDEKRRVPEREMLSAMEALIKSGGDLNKLDDQGATPLHIAAACGYLDVACFVLQHGASLDTIDRDGWLPIHVAACWGQFEVIEMLTNFGAKLDLTTNSGETVFDICEDDKMQERLLVLREELKRRHTLQHDQQQNWSNINRGLVRRRSSNPRSASIRRTSMREKVKLSWKEARQEAETCSLVVATEDGAEEEAKAPVWMTSSLGSSNPPVPAISGGTSVMGISASVVASPNNSLPRFGPVSVILPPSPSAATRQRSNKTVTPEAAASPMLNSTSGNGLRLTGPPLRTSKSPKANALGNESPGVASGGINGFTERSQLSTWAGRPKSPVELSRNGFSFGDKHSQEGAQRSPSTDRHTLPTSFSRELGNNRRGKASDMIPTMPEYHSRRRPVSPVVDPPQSVPRVSSLPRGGPTNGVKLSANSKNVGNHARLPPNGTSSALLQHNAYYSPPPLDSLQQSPPNTSKWRQDRCDSRGRPSNSAPSKTGSTILLSTGTGVVGGVVATPLLTPGASLTRPPPKRELIGRSELSMDKSGKCCVVM